MIASYACIKEAGPNLWHDHFLILIQLKMSYYVYIAFIKKSKSDFATI